MEDNRIKRNINLTCSTWRTSKGVFEKETEGGMFSITYTSGCLETYNFQPAHHTVPTIVCYLQSPGCSGIQTRPGRSTIFSPVMFT